jgi:hypothetical protein
VSLVDRDDAKIAAEQAKRNQRDKGKQESYPRILCQSDKSRDYDNPHSVNCVDLIANSYQDLLTVAFDTFSKQKLHPHQARQWV